MTDYHQSLLTKINTRQATVAVIGLGYVGLPLAVELAKAGPFDVASRSIPVGQGRLPHYRPGPSTSQGTKHSQVFMLHRQPG